MSLSIADVHRIARLARIEIDAAQAEDVRVKLEPEPEGVRATFSFPISLDAFRVERPQLLLIKIDDRATISGDLHFGHAK